MMEGQHDEWTVEPVKVPRTTPVLAGKRGSLCMSGGMGAAAARALPQGVCLFVAGVRCECARGGGGGGCLASSALFLERSLPRRSPANNAGCVLTFNVDQRLSYVLPSGHRNNTFCERREQRGGSSGVLPTQRTHTYLPWSTSATQALLFGAPLWLKAC